MKFSIIIPVYNGEHTLERCVRSILAQTVTDWELLLIDDGSKDVSGEICNKYIVEDKRIRVIHQVNGGASSARNSGLENARGEWITFCDSDDWVDDNWLLLFEQQINNDVRLVVQGFIPHGTLWKEDTGINYVGDIKTTILALSARGLLGYLWSKAFRHDLIEKYSLRFDSKLRLREDELFVLQYMEKISTINCVKEGAYHYEVPNFSQKYAHLDLFDTFMKIYVVLKKIFPNEESQLIKNYVGELTQSLFYAFDMRQEDRYKKLKRYRKEVGKQVLGVTSLSSISRLTLVYIPTPFTYSLLEAKVKIVKLLNK